MRVAKKLGSKTKIISVAAITTGGPIALPSQPEASSQNEESLSFISSLSTPEANETKGNQSRALVTTYKRDTCWIIDSGAINHITYGKSLFQCMTPKQNKCSLLQMVP